MKKLNKKTLNGYKSIGINPVLAREIEEAREKSKKVFNNLKLSSIKK